MKFLSALALALAISECLPGVVSVAFSDDACGYLAGVDGMTNAQLHFAGDG